LYKGLVDKVTCIDWPGTLHQSQHIDVFADLNQPTDIPSSSFDTIISSSVLEHIWKHDIFWDEMTRTLAPRGHIILSVPFMYWLHEEPHDYFRWTRHALTRACEERGVKVVHLAPYGGGPDVLIDLIVRSVGSISMTVAGWIGRVATWLLVQQPVRSLSSKYAEKLPLGYVLVAEKPAF
jgi:SAM-dependent methyltransferase